MSRRDGRRTRRIGSRPSRHKEDEPAVDEDSPVIKLFRGYQHQLDKKHDKHERVVKLSRDITIESKRVIFLLHRISGDENRETILKDAEEKFKELREEKWRLVAEELQTEDHHQYIRAYTAGLQEYIEAISFWQFLKEKTLISVEQVEQRLRFTRPLPSQEETTLTESTKRDNDTSVTPSISKDDDADKSHISESQPRKTEMMHVHVPPTHYLLGIADLTGELMRMAIHSIGQGDFDLPFENCCFMRLIYDAFVSFGNVDRELTRKIQVLRQSLQKVEMACYTLQVRGSEIPKHMLAEALSKSTVDDLLSEDAPLEY